MRVQTAAAARSRSAAPATAHGAGDRRAESVHGSGLRVSDGSRHPFDQPGKCPRCGMELVAGIPDPTEYHLDLTVAPQAGPAERAGSTDLRGVRSRGNTAASRNSPSSTRSSSTRSSSAATCSSSCTIIPTWENGAFRYDVTFPKPGMYRVLGDFYPEAAAPQLITRNHLRRGRRNARRAAVARLLDEGCRESEVEFSTNPPEPVAGYRRRCGSR